MTYDIVCGKNPDVILNLFITLVDKPIIWNPVPLIQGGTRWYVLVQAGTYASGYMAVQKTSYWYKPVRTDIGNS